jgi:D-alanine-D-alanine ligase
VFNLCDGDEVNGAPGISVIRYLEEKKLIYTGAREKYYHLTTSKITMKRAFDDARVATSLWRGIDHPQQEINGVCDYIGTPVIVKPAVSGGSMGLGLKNVVNSDADLKNVIDELYKGYHGWDFTFGGLVAEKFVAGPEFTTFITGSYDQPDDIKVYQPVERVFNEKLPEQEKFLSFDRLWDTYEDEKPVGEKDYENLWEYFKPDASLDHAIKQLSIDAYCSVFGTGYGRIDIRMDKETGKMYVLEVNAQCGLSEDENYTSIGAMVRLGKDKFSDMLGAIIANALQTKLKHRKTATL